MCPVENPRKPGRPKDPELEARRRAEILAVAAVVFAKTGYAETDVQVIADGAGVGKATVYRYFPTKKDLFLAAVDSGLQQLSAEIDAVITNPTTDPFDRIAAAVRTYLAFFARRPEMTELFIQERAAFRDRHQPLYFATKEKDPCGSSEVAFLGELYASGRLRAVPPQQLMTVLGDLLYGTMMTNYLSGRPVDPDAQAKEILDVILLGIVSDAERKRHARAAKGKES
ncbi:TetR/AcrR family transcriptional regulator [Fimbriiglobus ruber]|uniref:Transcriptional regulator, TetR family n=1 Tax=Fimbriiglobus ruber TaxID=1908690 RepID=A0A225D4C9_9BACT|nr:TetR/AcrR family transcriptional regulator [Fimbriiglobus ruber]OWK36352.1 Transcriptional regulator, TetR family [Fimbriiglobus ruber]